MLVEIVYPVVITERKVIDISEEQFEEIQNMNLEEQAKYIKKLDNEKNMTYYKLIEEALDWGYGSIRQVK